jgi:FkbM family methyltransferase
MNDSRNTNIRIESNSCRYGTMSFFSSDMVIGKSLREYGEWAQSEIDLLFGFINTGDVVVDIGAFIGTHTTAFAEFVGNQGKVISFEPQPMSFSLLEKNITQNNLMNTELYNVALSDVIGTIHIDQELAARNPGGVILHPKDSGDISIVTRTLDSFILDKCNLIKIDVEGMELNVLRGAFETISRSQPIVYAEVLSLDKAYQIALWMRDKGYETLLHNYPVYNPNNYNHNSINIFDDAREVNLLFIPTSKIQVFKKNVDNQSFLAKIHTIDDLAFGFLKKPQYKYEILSKTTTANVFGIESYSSESEVMFLKNEIKKLKDESNYSKELVQDIYRSLSWRLTKPLRLFGKLARIANPELFKSAIHLLREGNIRLLTRQLLNAIRHFSNEPSLSTDQSSILSFSMQDFVDSVKANKSNRHILIIDHGLGGGANQYRDAFIATQVEKGNSVILLYYAIWISQYRIRYVNSGIQKEWFANSLDFLFDMVDFIRPQEFFFNNAYSFPDPLKIASILSGLKRRSGSTLTFSIHDFFCICPSYILLNEKFKYCDVPNIEKCRICLSKNKGEHFFLARDKDIDKWRQAWHACLEISDSILCYSESSKNILLKAYPDINTNNIKVIPHSVDYMKQTVRIVRGAKLNIGIVGALSEHKGAGIVRDIARLIDERSLPVSVTVIGTMESVPKSHSIHVTGKYRREDLPRIIEKTATNLFFVPSIWPETFCYVAEELMAMGVPIAVFNIGAPPERVSKYSKGLIIDDINAEAALTAMISFHKRMESTE